METISPHSDILGRERAKLAVQPIADEWCPLIDHLVNIGTHIVREAFDQSIDKPELMSVPLLCMSQLEMLDACSILLRECSLRPTALPVRTIFESSLYIRYICMDDEKLPERALSYFYEMERQPLRVGNQLAPLDDIRWEHVKRSHPKEKIYENIEAEHVATAKRRKNHSYPWHALFNGPKSMVELIDLVCTPKGKNVVPKEEKALYMDLCLTSHANDVYKLVTKGKGTLTFESIRSNAKEGQYVMNISLAMSLVINGLAFALTRNKCEDALSKIQDLKEEFVPRLSTLRNKLNYSN